MGPGGGYRERRPPPWAAGASARRSCEARSDDAATGRARAGTSVVAPQSNSVQLIRTDHPVTCRDPVTGHVTCDP